MRRGQEVKFLIEMDLFGTNIEGLHGVYLKTDENTGKHLFYVPVLGEWGELASGSFELALSGRVTKKNKEFVSRVRQLGSFEN